MGNAASLPLDPVAAQRPLFGHEPTPAIDPNLAGRIRHALGQGAFVDRVPRWVHTGDARLFDELEARVRWRAETRRMYDRTVATPRLFAHDEPGTPPPHPLVDDMAAALGRHYRVRFDHRSYALYRDGRDSVAYHRDRELRDRTRALVAIVTLGGPRTFRLRPHDPARRAPESTLSFRVGWGDLLVMGGTCQRHWEHGVPKTAQAAPRIAVMFRHRG